jgi:MinD-like ATPase involved in chromosome partitioning or flagellar assembly
MEPITLTTAAIGTAIATTLATKALEKTGERIGEKVFDETGKLLLRLKSKSPDTVTAIELAEQQPLDYGKAVWEVQETAKQYPEVAQAVRDVETAVKEEPNSKLAQAIQDIKRKLESQPPTVYNFAKLAEEIKAEKGAMVAQSITIENQTHNYT